MTKVFNPEALNQVNDAVKKWKTETLKKEMPLAHSEAGIPVDLVYTPGDVNDFDYVNDIGMPGEEPLVRGVYPNMYRGRLFTVRQIAGYGSPEDCNQRIKFLLGNGGTGISIVFDLPTVRGYDSDDQRAEGNVGQCGVTIDSIQDVEALYEGIPIEKISSSIVTHLPSTSVAILAMYLGMAERRGIAFKELSGTTQNDFMMETTVGSAPEILPPKDSFRLQCDVVEYAARNLPRWNAISFNGYNLREAGTTSVTEVGVAIANAKQTAQELMRRGLNPNDIFPRFSFFWDLFDDFFEEIAKCRASRRVFHKVTKELGATDLRAMMMRFHVQTAGISLTRVEPYNNIARAAIQGLAAVLGGAQSLHVDSYDEAFSAPTEEAALISLRTQQIIQAETGVVNTVDPLGGSYYVEYMTNQMVDRIEKYINDIEAQGGLVKAVESGWMHREISNFAYEQQKAIESGELKKVGLNYFPSKEASKTDISVFTYPDTEGRQRDKLAKLRAGRDAARVAKAMEQLAKACGSNENVMPYAIEAAKAEATLGEIEQVFRDHFGLWQFPLIGL